MNSNRLMDECDNVTNIELMLGFIQSHMTEMMVCAIKSLDPKLWQYELILLNDLISFAIILKTHTHNNIEL